MSMRVRYITEKRGGEGKLKLLKGYRTYIIAAALFVLGGLRALGYVDEATYQTAFSLLVPAGLATLRAGIGKEK